MRFPSLKGILFVAFLAALVCSAFSQGIKTYLALRKQYGIRQAVEVSALETMVGTRVMELKGTIKGTFQVGNRYSLLVERTDGATETIDSDAIPDWLSGGNSIPARIIIRASRSDIGMPLHAILIAVAPEDQIAPIEQAEQQKAKKAAEPQTKQFELHGEIRPFKQQSIPKDWNLPSSEATPYYAAFIKKENPKLSNAKAMEIARAIIGFSLKYGVDARLIMAMVMVESDFNPHEVSSAGAMGLGQLMPSNVQEMGVTDVYDTNQNLSATVRLVRGHLNDYRNHDSFENLVLALAAYNAGPGAVRKYGGVPPYKETQNYVKKVIKLYNEFRGVK